MIDPHHALTWFSLSPRLARELAESLPKHVVEIEQAQRTTH
jgi:hypothetical protein